MKRVHLLYLLLLTVCLTACGSRSAPAQSASSEASSTVTSAETVQQTVYPLTVTDMAGREVVIASEPKRIVSGYYISTSTCIALGLQDRLVGVEEKAEIRPIYQLAAPELIQQTNVGSAKSFNLEACIASEPDLVLLPMKQKDAAEALAEVGIPSIVLLPESHQQLLEMFSMIGEITNSAEQANVLTTYYTSQMSKVENLTADLTDSARPVVYIGGTSSYLTTAPEEMYQASLIQSVGGVNAANELEGVSWTEISYEQLIAMNPDVIVIPTNNFATSSPEYTVEDVLADEQLSEITAVKNGAVYQMTPGFEAWDSPTPSGILGTLWMLKTIHPELYSAEQFVADAQAFYQEFYHFTPDAASLMD